MGIGRWVFETRKRLLGSSKVMTDLQGIKVWRSFWSFIEDCEMA